MKTLLRSAMAASTMVLVFTLLGGVVAAHHGRAGYIEASTVKGTVTSVEWKNPHCFINFDVKDDKEASFIGSANFLHHKRCWLRV